jgi:hypothetical protein
LLKKGKRKQWCVCGAGKMCLGRISSQRRAQTEEAQERAMPRNLPYEQGYQKEELLCTESNAQPAVETLSIR